jgi:DNA-binding NarL/FixJ family response regulator
MNIIKVFVADDHQLVIDGLKLMFEDTPNIVFVGSANNGQLALEELAKQEIDVLLLDINMPVMNGIECCGLARKQFPNLKILALSMMEDASLVKEMLKAGASGFLLKNAGQDEVISAIERVYAGEQAFSNEILKIVMGSFSDHKDKAAKNNLPKISRREKQILKLIVWEKTTQEIAEELFISFGTVETHRRNLLHKLDVKNTAGLVRVAMENKLLDE